MRTVEAALIIEAIGERQDGRDQWLTINPENPDVSCHPVPPLDRPHPGREEGFDHRSHIVRLIRSHIQWKIVEWPRPRLCSPTGAAILPALLAPPATDSSTGFTSSASVSQMNRTSSRGKPGLNTSASNAASRSTCHTLGFCQYHGPCSRSMLPFSRAGWVGPLSLTCPVIDSAGALRGHTPSDSRSAHANA